MGQRRPWGEAGHHGPGQGQVRLHQGIAAAHQGIAGPKSSGWSCPHRCTSGLWDWRGGCQGGGSSSNGRRSCSGNEGGSHRDGGLEVDRTAGNGGKEGGHGRHQHRCFHDVRGTGGALSPDRRNNIHPIGGWRAPGRRWAFQPAGRVERNGRNLNGGLELRNWMWAAAASPGQPTGAGQARSAPACKPPHGLRC